MNTFTIFLVLIIIVAFLLVVVVMVQNPKGGGLSSSFGGGGTQQLGGVKKTTDFLDKSTWTLGIILIALILLSSLAFNDGDGTVKIDKTVGTSAAQTETAAPAATPAPVESTPAETAPQPE